jgi:diadenosine tetraphosphate (Ap4A) HIT family hydrolase
MNCPFCDDKNVQSRIIFKNDLVMVFPTNIPITVGHTLICPVRHISKIDQLSDEEIKAIKDLIIRIKNSLTKSFNHLHIHVVPRKAGDTGIYEYEPRQFLYRPGSRNVSPESELKEVAEMIKKNF